MTEYTDRKHDRIDSLHLLSYGCIDKATGQKKEGMGRTLNVSKGGILLETHISMSLDDAISLNIGIEDNTVSITGKVIYFRDAKVKGRFESGIEFLDMDEYSQRVLDKYIIAFRESKHQS